MQTKDLIRALQTQNDCLTLALSDLAKGETKWFGRRTPEGFALGVSRPSSACGGILAVWQGGCVSAHYLERYVPEAMAQISACITGENTEYNRDLLARRAMLESAVAYVRSAQA